MENKRLNLSRQLIKGSAHGKLKMSGQGRQHLTGVRTFNPFSPRGYGPILQAQCRIGDKQLGIKKLFNP